MIYFLEVFGINTKGVQINEEIRDAEVRLIGENGEQLGIFSAKDAQKIAIDKGLDLVKKQKVIVLKEVQLSLNIETHDFNTKLKHALRFLSGGNKVKVTLRLRSREIQRPELGIELMERFADGVQEVGNVEKAAKLESRTLIMILAPKTDK